MEMSLSRIGIILILCPVLLAATGQQPAASLSVSQISPGTMIQVEVSNDIDAKKAHPGNKVETKLWGDVRNGNQIILPKKTVILGHVVDVQPRSKSNPESKLSIAFDKAVLKNGSEFPLHGTVVRVQLSPMALATAPKNDSRLYSPNPGSTTNIAMPAQLPEAGQGGPDGQLPVPGPTNVRDPDISVQPDAAGTVTVLASSKKDVKLKHYATLDVKIAP